MLRNTSSRLSILAAAVAAMGIGSFVRADTIITDFTPGDLVVLRGGDATNPDSPRAERTAFPGHGAAFSRRCHRVAASGKRMPRSLSEKSLVKLRRV